MDRNVLLGLLAGVLLVVSMDARAEDSADMLEADPVLQAVVASTGSLAYHPDMRFRIEGVRALERGRRGEAAALFKLAARHADKPSQAMLAEMYFTGNGVDQDRARGYAWMDLAAERGWPTFVLIRERYWSELSEDERARAVTVGHGIYEEYEDAVAKPRLERQLRRGRRESTGSRVGGGGNTVVETPSGLYGSGTRAHVFDRRHWEPDHYWALQDEAWGAPRPERVEVGPLSPTH